MPKYESWEDLSTKAEWEGGLADFIFDYGVGVEDLPDTDSELGQAMVTLIEARPAYDRVMNLLPMPEDE